LLEIMESSLFLFDARNPAPDYSQV